MGDSQKTSESSRSVFVMFFFQTASGRRRRWALCGERQGDGDAGAGCPRAPAPVLALAPRRSAHASVLSTLRPEASLGSQRAYDRFAASAPGSSPMRNTSTQTTRLSGLTYLKQAGKQKISTHVATWTEEPGERAVSLPAAGRLGSAQPQQRQRQRLPVPRSGPDAFSQGKGTVRSGGREGDGVLWDVSAALSLLLQLHGFRSGQITT